MVIPCGYRRTEIGILPADWELHTFAQLLRILPNNTLPREDLDQAGEVRNLHYGDILTKFGPILDCRKAVIPFLARHAPVPSARSLLRSGDVVLADTAEDEMVGRAVEVQNLGEGKLVAGLHTIPCRPRGNHFAPGWLGYFLNAPVYHNQLLPLITGAKVSSLSREAVLGTLLPVPPYAEQQAIVRAVSDMDQLLASVEELAAKKRRIRQGVLGELLTGARRLEGFGGAWLPYRLGELCTIHDGTHQTPRYVEHGVPFYSVENVTGRDFIHTRYISTEEHERLSASCVIERGDILMTRIGSIGECQLVDWDVHASFYVSLALLKCGPLVDARFLYFYSFTDDFQREVELNALNMAIPRKINLGPIGRIRVFLPPTLEEQRAISATLATMEREEGALAEKSRKLCRIRQGLLDELLTGRNRLTTAH